MRLTGPPEGGRHLGRVVALCPCAAGSAFAPVGSPLGKLDSSAASGAIPVCGRLGPLKEVGTSAASWRYARARPRAHSPQWGPRWGSLTLRPRRAPYPHAADWPPEGGWHLGRVVALCPCAAESRKPWGSPLGKPTWQSPPGWLSRRGCS